MFGRWVTMCVAVVVCTLAGCSGSASNHPLVGQKAPEFKASLLDETPVTLSQYLGEKVVILDFWATWCPPCRAALPTLSEVAAEYQDRGVVLLAVDQGEEPALVQEFLQGTGLELTVVLDRDSSIGKQYQVNGIPQTVIIGKDGIVQAVHVGFRSAPDLRTKLHRELDTLLNGGKLAAPTGAQNQSIARN